MRRVVLDGGETRCAPRVDCRMTRSDSMQARRDDANIHSPFVNKMFDGVMFQPPYLFTCCTCGLGGRPSGKVVLHCDWNRSRERNDVSMESGLFGSPRW